ncbi:MAG: cobalt ECF transporter T component CbiQ [Rubrobacteraceae bacterium]
MGGDHRRAEVETVAGKDSPVHQLDPRVKILGLIGLVVVSVSLPPGAWVAFAAIGTILVGLVALSRLHPLHVLRRMTVEIPFLLAAAILPFTAEDGLTLGVTVGIKITVGVLAMVILSSTTPFPQLLRGFELLRVPRLIILITALMWRYLYVLVGQAGRMKTARAARGYSGSGLRQAISSTGPLLASLFLRSLERGERVHLAMMSRGYTGGIPAAVAERLTLRPLDVAFLTLLVAALVTIRVLLP